MCGFVGFVDKTKNKDITIKKMADLIKHRGPDSDGYYVDDDIALGFDENALGGIVNSTRNLMCAYKSDLWKNKFAENEYAKATRAEALRMKDELNSALKNKNN